jgi:hypothetical protein
MATLSSTLTVTAAAPVAKFEVRVKLVGGSTYFVSDPATDDPNSDGAIELIPDVGGLTASIQVDRFLVGQVTGAYTAEARAIDENDQPGNWASQGFNYNPPGDVTITVS